MPVDLAAVEATVNEVQDLDALLAEVTKSTMMEEPVEKDTVSVQRKNICSISFQNTLRNNNFHKMQLKRWLILVAIKTTIG